MKYLISIVFFLFVLHESHAQNLNMGLNFTDAGRNITVQYELVRQQNEYSFGLGVNLNNFRQIEIGSDIYRKKLYATEAHHYINLNFTYQRYILKDKMKYLEPFIFYDLQARYAPAALLSMYIEYDSTLVQTRTEQGIIGYEMLSYLGPFTWIEQNVGLGFKAPLTERFYLKQRFGVGVNMILGYDDSLVSKRFSWFDWEFSTLMHFSVGYTLK